MSIFKFKQFDVDQTGCAMKVNTDGVLMAALAEADDPKSIVDIGTGTGVIALMLAQRFTNAQIDAVEIDKNAANTAQQNFKNSKYNNRIASHFISFEYFFDSHPQSKFDLIVSNPPFFLDSLISSNDKKTLAKHTDSLFFKRLLVYIFDKLNNSGTCQMIVPLATASVVKSMLPELQLYIQKVLAIKSFADSVPHREILIFGKEQKDITEDEFVIYDAPKVYSKGYQMLLSDFLTIF